MTLLRRILREPVLSGQSVGLLASDEFGEIIKLLILTDFFLLPDREQRRTCLLFKHRLD